MGQSPSRTSSISGLRAVKPEIDEYGQESSDENQNQQPGQTVRRTEPRVKRNDPCPCGSGKKYKQCHGQNV
jgi:preprotein translocase subunit SecA